MGMTRDGGKPVCKPLPYNTPQGPKGQSHCGPGLGGENYGNAPKGRPSESGRPGIGGTNHGTGPQR